MEGWDETFLGLKKESATPKLIDIVKIYGKSNLD
jgi:hypothetical protein